MTDNKEPYDSVLMFLRRSNCEVGRIRGFPIRHINQMCAGKGVDMLEQLDSDGLVSVEIHKDKQAFEYSMTAKGMDYLREMKDRNY